MAPARQQIFIDLINRIKNLNVYDKQTTAMRGLNKVTQTVSRQLTELSGTQEKLTKVTAGYDKAGNPLVKTLVTTKDVSARLAAQQEKTTNAQKRAGEKVNNLRRKQQALTTQNKFLREQSQRMGITTDKVRKSMAAVDLEFNKQGKVVGKAGQNIRVTNRLMNRGRVASKGFQFGWLSVMFAGMALNRVFSGLIKSQLQLFGITEVFSGALTLVMLPVMMLLLPLFLKLAEVFMSMPDGVKLVIGVYVILLAAMALTLLIIGQVMLAMEGFGLLGSASLGAIAFAILGVIVGLLGIALVISGIIIIVQNWGEDWIAVLKGVALVLAGFGLVLIGIAILMGLWPIAFAGAALLILAGIILLTALIIKNWDEIKDAFMVAWAIVGNFFAEIWNDIVSDFQAGINLIIAGINTIIRASNRYLGTRYGEIGPVNISKFKAQIYDIEAFRERLAQKRRNKELVAMAKAERTVAEKDEGGFLSNLIPEKFTGPNPASEAANSLQEININNTNTFNVSDKEEMQKMIDENMAKQVEEIKRLIAP